MVSLSGTCGRSRDTGRVNFGNRTPVGLWSASARGIILLARPRTNGGARPPKTQVRSSDLCRNLKTESRRRGPRGPREKSEKGEPSPASLEGPSLPGRRKRRQVPCPRALHRWEPQAGHPPRRESPGPRKTRRSLCRPPGWRDSDPTPGPSPHPVHGVRTRILGSRWGSPRRSNRSGCPSGVAPEVAPPASAGGTAPETSSARFGRRSARKGGCRMVRVTPLPRALRSGPVERAGS